MYVWETGTLCVHIIYIHHAPEVTLRELEFWPVKKTSPTKARGWRIGAC